MTEDELKTEDRTEPENGEPEQDGDATPAEEPEPKRRRRLTLSLPVTIVLAVLLLGAVGGGVTFALLFKQEADLDAARQAALSTARSYAVTVTTYDYQNLDANFADVLDGSTGEFKDQYTGASGSLRQLIEQAKATAKGHVIDAGVKSITTDRAEIALFVDQSVTNAATDKPRVDRNRVLMTLERHDTRWLISNLQLL